MDEYIKVIPASRKLNITPSTVYRWIRQGKIQPKWVKSQPNGVLLINVKGLIYPKPKKRSKNQLFRGKVIG